MSTDAQPFLDLDGVAYAYGDDPPTVTGVDLRVPAGAFHCLVGRSGSGKTTLLKLAAGLLRPGAGAARIQGAPIDGPAPAVGFVFQTPSLLEWRTVLDNVLLPISLKRQVTAADRAAAHAALERIGIGGHAQRYPGQLSGGQQSRTALARALITEPPALLMDEPFAALDAITREGLQDDLLRLAEDRRTTVLFVTHDIAEAVYLGDHVSVMERGRIAFDMPVALDRPRAVDIRYDPGFNALCRDIRRQMAAASRMAA